MGTVSKKFGFIRATLAMWTGNLFAGRAGVVTDSTPGPVERWGWYDGSTWRFSARSGASETFADVVLSNLTANNLPRLDANKKTVASAFGDDGTTATCSRPITTPHTVSQQKSSADGSTASISKTITLPPGVFEVSVYSSINDGSGSYGVSHKTYHVSAPIAPYPYANYPPLAEVVSSQSQFQTTNGPTISESFAANGSATFTSTGTGSKNLQICVRKMGESSNY